MKNEASFLGVLLAAIVTASCTKSSDPSPCDQVIRAMKGPSQEGKMDPHAHHEGHAGHEGRHEEQIPFSRRFAMSKEMLGRMGEQRWDCLKGALASEDLGILKMAVLHLSQEETVGQNAVKKWIGDPNGRVRAGVALVIGQGGKTDLGDLTGLLRDTDALVRQAAIVAVRDLDLETKRISELVEPLLKDPEAQVRGEAASALGFKRSLSSASALLPLLSDGDPEVVIRGIYALKNLFFAKKADDSVKRQISSSAAVPLTRLITSSNPRIQKAAIMSLGKFRVEAAIDPIIRRLDLLDPELLPVAFQSLKEITGANVPENVASWKNWRRASRRP